MDFYGEETEQEKKLKKTSKIILISMVLLIIAVIAIICVIMYLKSSQFRIIIDGKTVSNVPEDLFIIDNGKVYVSIKDFAPYTNTVINSEDSSEAENPYAYQAHDGEYKYYVQDPNKCYVENDYETASFFLNSNRICKLAKDSKDDYDVYEVSEPVRDIYSNGKMYVLSEGIEIAFNLRFSYNAEANNITIMTLPYILSSYSQTLVNSGYTGNIEDFNNQKAVLYGLFVVQKGNNDSYGVITLSNNKWNEVINIRYSKIEFNEKREEFLVTDTSGKVGIFLSTGVTKINLNYDEIKMIDADYGLYLVKSGNKYGIINDKEVKIVHLEYDSIGIDASNYPSNNITNQYLLYDNVIPVKQNNLWGLFDRSGNKILNVEYDSIGCIASTVKNKVSNNLLLIPEIEAIVVCKDKKYGLIDSTGKELIPCATDVMYSTTEAGVDTYYMDYTVQNPDESNISEKTSTYTYDIIDYLVQLNIIENPNKDKDIENNNIDNTNNINSNSKDNNNMNINISANTTNNNPIGEYSTIN